MKSLIIGLTLSILSPALLAQSLPSGTNTFNFGTGSGFGYEPQSQTLLGPGTGQPTTMGTGAGTRTPPVQQSQLDFSGNAAQRQEALPQDPFRTDHLNPAPRPGKFLP